MAVAVGAVRRGAACRAPPASGARAARRRRARADACAFGGSGGGEYAAWPAGGGLVSSLAHVADDAQVHPGALVMEGAEVGAGCVVGPNSVVGPGVSVGAGSVLHFGVHLSHCDVGERCTFHHGAAVGADGFGFDVDTSTGRVVKKPQELRVRIGDDVEVGANSCIDRGSWRDTVLGDECKLDNGCQVGHNAVLGRGCLLCGHVALGGSSTLGDYVVMGGKSAAKDHVTIASGVRVAAKSGVIQDVTERGDVGGYPAMPAREWRRREAAMRRLTKRKRATQRAPVAGESAPDE